MRDIKFRIFHIRDAEVIGNIYKNPELIGVQKCAT